MSWCNLAFSTGHIDLNHCQVEAPQCGNWEKFQNMFKQPRPESTGRWSSWFGMLAPRLRCQHLAGGGMMSGHYRQAFGQCICAQSIGTIIFICRNCWKSLMHLWSPYFAKHHHEQWAAVKQCQKRPDFWCFVFTLLSGWSLIVMMLMGLMKFLMGIGLGAAQPLCPHVHLLSVAACKQRGCPKV